MPKKTLLIWDESPGSPTVIKFDAVLSITHESMTEVTEHPVETGSNVADNARPNNRRIQIEGLVSNTPMATNTDLLTPNRILGANMVPSPPNDFMDTEKVSLDIASGPGYRETSQRLEIPQKPVKFGNPAGQATSAIRSLAVAATGGTTARVLKRSGTSKVSAKAFLLTATEFRDRVKEMYEALERARSEAQILRVETRMGDYESMVIESVTVPRTAQDGNSATFSVSLREIRIVNALTVDAPTPAEPLGSPKKALGSQNKSEDDANKDANKKRSLLIKAADAGFDALGSLF